MRGERAARLLCSRNAHNQNVLVRRAQCETNRATRQEREIREFGKGVGEAAGMVSVLAEPPR
jgi:hypothetical protein